ncbi:MAG: cysteine methyltransferase [Lysobacterales bacterium CG17_big_fil_post_rev_8_21_14_2_50_64_11]|nr:MAG: cysteine methyltransferase [Xanthomonadales bacterium CG17_big_fil_post_rev_8_21_14_2_50_64_11]PIX61527.1 MAG: cysteine methyltransferase [Xanthomonadales bacterium CG_4_10_14_3_um_filter_64_11]
MMIYEQFDTPVGVLTIAADHDGLRHIEFPCNRHPVVRAGWASGTSAVLDDARRQLLEYFAGRRRHFDLPLCPRGTVFQLRVWQVLADIPFGRTWSYQQLAQACGNANAMRAVGAANGRNPLPIVLPCHRVIGADGSLTGFGGGIETKAALLRLEGALR